MANSHTLIVCLSLFCVSLSPLFMYSCFCCFFNKFYIYVKLRGKELTKYKLLGLWNAFHLVHMWIISPFFPFCYSCFIYPLVILHNPDSVIVSARISLMPVIWLMRLQTTLWIQWVKEHLRMNMQLSAQPLLSCYNCFCIHHLSVQINVPQVIDLVRNRLHPPPPSRL